MSRNNWKKVIKNVSIIGKKGAIRESLISLPKPSNRNGRKWMPIGNYFPFGGV